MLTKNFLILLLIFILTGIALASLRDKVSQYVYGDTKQLVLFVENAAALMEQKGTGAFKDFDQKNSYWFNNNYYLFVYSINGECVFHPIEPSLIGKNLINFQDIDGRPVIEMITDIGYQPAKDASGWVFYKWEDPYQSSFPQWKSSYIRKVISPDKKVYLIGSGLYNMKLERVFIKQQVDKAIEMIYTKGKITGFNALRFPELNYDIMDSYIIIANASGDVIVTPNFPSITIHRNIMNFIDKSGKNIGKEVFNALQTKDEQWISYLWPKGETQRLTRKIAYIRKINLDNECHYVIMDYFPSIPIWMK